MAKRDKLLQTILSGRSDSNIQFSDLCYVLKQLGFDERIKGDHHIFTRSDLAEILNIQPKGSKSKPYQVKQSRNILVKYKLGG